MGIKLYLFLLTAWLSAAFCFAQDARPSAKPVTRQSPAQTATSSSNSSPAQRRPKRKLPPQKQFVLDVARMAVALPQPDPQDRLRVLTAAINVVGPVNSALARRYAREGALIEADLVARGQKPAVSVLSAGHFDCAGAVSFVDQIPSSAVLEAEQSLINLMSICPKQATEPVRRKLEAGLNDGTLAPRGILAMVERSGPKSNWSQTNFARMFGALPSEPEKAHAEAPNYAAMFNRMAPEVDKDIARDAGLRLLVWLGKLKPGNERNLAVNMTVDSLKQALGSEAYDAALRTDLVARDVANSAGQPGEIEHPEEENVSVMSALGQVGKDQTERISKLSASLRAREAAAHGFASGTSGDPKGADRYFDIAFSALDEVWGNRDQQKDAPEVVQEVSEAAAQVSPVSALRRTQGLGDPSAQAIGMLSVARVVLGQLSEVSNRPGATAEKENPIR